MERSVEEDLSDSKKEQKDQNNSKNMPKRWKYLKRPQLLERDVQERQLETLQKSLKRLK